MTAPTEKVRAELESVLQDDGSRVGDVFRRPGMTPEQIAADLGVGTHNFVFNNRYTIRALLEGVLPGGDALRRQVASKVHSIRRDRSISQETRAYLEHLHDRLLAGDPSPGPSRRRMAPSSDQGPVATRRTSMRTQVEEEVRRRTKELVERIHAETDLRALDYRSVVASERPLDAVVRVIRWRGDDGTFDDLLRLGRRDLTLEQAVVTWAEDLPLTFDLVDEAAARIDWTI